MPDLPEGFDVERVPPVCWELGAIDRVKKIIALADRDKCQDCLPKIFIVPWAPEGYTSTGTWVLVQMHDESCPSFHQRPQGMEWLNE